MAVSVRLPFIYSRRFYNNRLSQFTTSLSSILISHFMLDLQDAYQRQAGHLFSDHWALTSSSSVSDSLSFARRLGSLASHIDSIDEDLPETE